MTDILYETLRNSLIPQAVKYANKLHGKRPPADYFKWAKQWNLTYLQEMDRLVSAKLSGKLKEVS